MIKRLLSCVREYKKDSILSPLYVTFEVVMEVIIPLLMAKLIDFGINVGDMNYIVKMGLILAVCCVISLAFGALSGSHAARASAGFAKNLRHNVFSRIQSFSFQNIDKFSISLIISLASLCFGTNSSGTDFSKRYPIPLSSPNLLYCSRISNLLL